MLSILNKKFIKNFSANLMTKVVITVSQFALIPLFLKFWGNDLYADWLMISTIPNYLMLSDFGLNATASNEYCKLVTIGSIEQAQKLFCSVNTLFLLIAFFLIFMVGITGFFVNYKSLFNLHIVDHRIVLLSLFLFVVNVFATLLQSFTATVFRADNRFYVSQNFTTLIYFLDFSVILIVLLMNFECFFIPLGQSISRFCVICIQHFLFKKIVWFEQNKYFSMTLKHSYSMIKSSLNHSMLTLGFAVVLQGNSFVVGKYLGGDNIIKFNTVRTLINSIKSIISVYYSTFLPQFTVWITMEQFRQVRTKFIQMVVVVIISTLIACTLMYFYGKDILIYWTKSKVSVSNDFLFIMLIGGGIQVLWNALSMLPISVNDNKMFKVYPVLSLVGIFVSAISLKSFGLISVGYNLLFVDVSMLVLFVLICRKYLR